MPYFVNVLICIVCIAVLVGEILLIARRNRKILVKGKDDFFIPVMAMLALVLIMPLDNTLSAVSALRNTVAIMAVFVTFAVKRGVSERGVEKLCWTVPWDKISMIHVNPHQTTTVTVIFELHTGRANKLIFHYVRLRPLLRELQRHLDRKQILLEQSVEREMERYSKT